MLTRMFRIQASALGPMDWASRWTAPRSTWFRELPVVGIGCGCPPGRSGARVELRTGPVRRSRGSSRCGVIPPRRRRAIAVLLGFAAVAGLTAVLLRGPAAGRALAVGLFAAGLFVLAESPPLLLC